MKLKMIKMFYHDDIEMRELRDLIAHPEQREQCVAFIDSLIEQ